MFSNIKKKLAAAALTITLSISMVSFDQVEQAHAAPDCSAIGALIEDANVSKITSGQALKVAKSLTSKYVSCLLQGSKRIPAGFVSSCNNFIKSVDWANEVEFKTKVDTSKSSKAAFSDFNFCLSRLETKSVSVASTLQECQIYNSLNSLAKKVKLSRAPTFVTQAKSACIKASKAAQASDPKKLDCPTIEGLCEQVLTNSTNLRDTNVDQLKSRILKVSSNSKSQIVYASTTPAVCSVLVTNEIVSLGPPEEIVGRDEVNENGGTCTVSATASKNEKYSEKTLIFSINVLPSGVIKSFAKKGSPSVIGAPTVGLTLKADPGEWDSGASFTYRWFRGASHVGGAYNEEYLISAEDVGYTIFFEVTATKKGFNSETKKSIPTSQVRLAEQTQIGQVKIIGVAEIGQELSLDTGSWDTGAQISVTWMRNGEPIVGETSKTFVLSTLDIGASISAIVTSRKIGYSSAKAVAMFGNRLGQPKFPNLEIPVIEGTPQVGSVLTARSGPWPMATILTYEWARSGSPISGATSSTYKLSHLDLGEKISVEVRANKRTYTPASLSSLETAEVSAANFGTMPAPILSGAAQVGRSLSVVLGTWPSGTTFTYSWHRAGTAIAGAINPTYQISLADSGQSLHAKVTADKPGFESMTLISNSTLEVPAPALSLAATPQIVGQTIVGSTLNALVGTWDAGTDLTYQWLRNGVEIPGAALPQYQLTPADLASSISLVVTGSKQGYLPAKRGSPSSALISPGTISQFATPAISGNLVVGETLSAEPGNWDSQATLSFQWFSAGTAISGATSKTYTLRSSDYGKALSFTTGASKLGYNPKSATSNLTALVKSIPFESSPTPSVAGTAMVGKQLTATVGIWDVGTGLTYQWLRNGIEISGATSTTYSVTLLDLGCNLTFRTTGIKPGAISTLRTSLATSTVLPFAITTFSTPSISGISKVEQTLIGNPGTWESGAALTFYWTRNDVTITGANSTSYSLVAGDIGAVIKFGVRGSLQGSSKAVSSAGTAPVAQGALSIQTSPAVSGALRVGTAAVATLGNTVPFATSITYKWFVNGVESSQYRNSSYSISMEADAKLSLEVTYSRAGYTSLIVKSPESSPITKGVYELPTPSLVGAVRIGSTLSVTASGIPGLFSGISYQWNRNGTAIPGATGTTYISTNADSGLPITVLVSSSAAGYEVARATSNSITVGIAPVSPSITQLYEKTTSLQITWVPAASMSYLFEILNTSGSVVASSPCATSCSTPLVISGLAPGNSYNLRVTTSSTGGTTTFTRAFTSYPTLTLTTVVSSFGKIGDRLVANFVPQVGWTYQLKPTPTCGSQAWGGPTATTSPATWLTTLANTYCGYYLILTDGRGNTGQVSVGKPWNQPDLASYPAPLVAGSLSATTLATGGFTIASFSTSSESRTTKAITVENSAGVVQNLASVPTIVQSSGNEWVGNYSAGVSFTGLTAGDYKVFVSVTDSAGSRTKFEIGAVRLT